VLSVTVPQACILYPAVGGIQVGLHIEIDGVRNSQARAQMERAIRECIGQLPNEEEWDVSFNRKDGQSVLVVRTPHQARRKVFYFSNDWDLSEAIPAWLQEHPVH